MAEDARVEAFFADRDRALRERLREQLEGAADEMRRQRKVAESFGSEASDLVERLYRLGVEASTAPALHLLPLVVAAWAEDSLDDAQRHALLRPAIEHGIEPGTQAGTYLAAMLEDRPSDALLDELIELIRDLLDEEQARPGALRGLCEQLAAATGRFFEFPERLPESEIGAIVEAAERIPGEARRRIVERFA